MEFSGFDWDHGNRSKCQTHGVSPRAIEGLFDGPVAILPDAEHSEAERRFRAIGRTKQGRTIFVAFTLRRRDADVLIRPISARYMHDKEVKSYESQNPGLPK